MMMIDNSDDDHDDMCWQHKEKNKFSWNSTYNSILKTILLLFS